MLSAVVVGHNRQVHIGVYRSVRIFCGRVQRCGDFRWEAGERERENTAGREGNVLQSDTTQNQSLSLPLYFVVVQVQ